MAENFANLNIEQPTSDLSGLIGKLRTIDAKNLREVKRWRIIFGVMVLFYIGICILQSKTIILIDTTGLLIFFITFTLYYRKLSKKDYSVPVKQLLVNTRKNFRFINPVFVILAITSFPMIYGGLHTLFSNYLDIVARSFGKPWHEMAVIVGFYLVVLVLAYVVWHVKYHKVIEEINKNLKELEE